MLPNCSFNGAFNTLVSSNLHHFVMITRLAAFLSFLLFFWHNIDKPDVSSCMIIWIFLLPFMELSGFVIQKYLEIEAFFSVGTKHEGNAEY